MTLFLNSLFILVGVLFFAGRMYEVVYLLEEGTHFLLTGGIVTTPLMMGIVFLIAVCCGVLVFADKGKQSKNMRFPVGLFGIAPAPFILAASVMNIIGIFKKGGFLGYDIMMIAASLGLAALGAMHIKGKASEKIPVALVMLMPLAMCMKSVLINIQPIANTMFLYYSLSAITVLVFFLLLFKNAYAPSPFALPMLYISALVNFIICGAATLANFIGGAVTKAVPMADLLLNIALAVIGVYSLFVAFYIMPTTKMDEKPQKKVKKAPQPVYVEEAEEEYVSDFLPRQKDIATSAKAVWREDDALRQSDKISRDTIAMLFAQKDEKEHQAVIDTAVKEATTELVVTQAVEKHNEDYEATKQVNMFKTSSTKTVFKSNGKKETSGKVVYKAPKK